MRGRKPGSRLLIWFSSAHKKRIPEWGDGNHLITDPIISMRIIKKESPNEGTETSYTHLPSFHRRQIKKESPNEGTETCGNDKLATFFNQL